MLCAPLNVGFLSPDAKLGADFFARGQARVAEMAEAAFGEAMPLACPVCFGLPAAGEWHQCLEGHCYCIDCWRRLRPRRCPECKDPIPLRNRSKAQEAMVAALLAVCDRCGETTTLGAMAQHLRVCQQPPAQRLRLAGCGWEGTAAERFLHQVACPYCCTSWEQCQLQQSYLQPLAGLVRALDEEEEEEGGRLRRQRVGPAPQDNSHDSHV